MKLNFKSFISGFLVCVVLMTVSIPIFAKTETIKAFYNNIKMSVNGKNIKFADGEEPFVLNGRTFVPAKYVAENLNASVSWNETDNTVVITSKSSTTSKSAIDAQSSTTLPVISAPEVSSENNPNVITRLREGDNTFEITTYNGYNAIKYKEYTYVFIPDLKLISKLGKNNELKLYKVDDINNPENLELILETENADYKYYVTYRSGFYININLVGNYLE